MKVSMPFILKIVYLAMKNSLPENEKSVCPSMKKAVLQYEIYFLISENYSLL